MCGGEGAWQQGCALASRGCGGSPWSCPQPHMAHTCPSPPVHGFQEAPLPPGPKLWLRECHSGHTGSAERLPRRSVGASRKGQSRWRSGAVTTLGRRAACKRAEPHRRGGTWTRGAFKEISEGRGVVIHIERRATGLLEMEPPTECSVSASSLSQCTGSTLVLAIGRGSLLFIAA